MLKWLAEPKLGERRLVGCHGVAPCSIRLRAGASLPKFAAQANAKVELNHRDQTCEVLIDTGISRRVKWSKRRVTLPLVLAPEASASLLGYALKNPSALNLVSGHYSDRARSLPADRVQLGKWTGMSVARRLFRFGRPACVSQHLCPI